MQFLDWAIVGIFFTGLIIIAALANSLTKSIADFLAANRCAGRYLLTVASGMAMMGAISIAGHFEQYYQAGFGALWWGQMLAPLMLVLALSGFIVYRYRETRALTLAQFFEMRYSRNFRVFAGILSWLSGILNYGIFPAVTARFLIYFCGLPTSFDLFGFELSTFPTIMAILLSVALLMTLSGGQVAIMITDFIQGQFVALMLLVILAILFSHLSWGDLMEGLHYAPEGESRINPFDQKNVPEFNVWFFAMMAFIQVYSYFAWQGTQGYNAAAKSPHEAKMAKILGEFRGMVTLLVVSLIPIFIFAYLNLPEFANEAAAIERTLDQLGDEQLREQMRVPTALGTLLPVGVMGLFAAVIISAAVSTDNTFIHSWGSIFVQDVLLPLRKKPLTPRAHIWWLRISIFGVSAFAFLWSLYFPLQEYIYMYFQLTGAIYLGGAGAAIIGGFYWARGTAGGAWAAMIVGLVLSLLGIVLRNIVWPFFLPGWRENYPDSAWLSYLPEKFPLHGVEMAFYAALGAIFAYIIVSLLSKTEPANMQKLLHRGPYAVPEGSSGKRHLVSAQHPLKSKAPRTWMERLGMGPEFTKGDKAIYIFKLGWTGFFFTIFIIGTVAGVFLDLEDSVWERWWMIHIGLTVVVGTGMIIWFLIGGIRDIIDLVRTLRTVQRDMADDGTVIDADRVQGVKEKSQVSDEGIG
ncbi:MAG TPA: sodium:solute symporter [Opitutales bacterium]|nr:sodium:solute symporter [Opitutales bacterium]